MVLYIKKTPCVTLFSWGAPTCVQKFSQAYWALQSDSYWLGVGVADDFHFLSAIRNLLLKHPELGCRWFWLLVGLNIQVPPFGMC